MTEMTITGTNRVRPGISSYVTDPPSVKTDLVRLLNSAATVVPQELQGLTPVYLKATAGMRLLEPNDVDAIFDQINQLFEDSSQNPFKFERGWAKVISVFSPLSILASRYDLYTNSYLKFGQDQFRLQLYGLLYDQAADKNAYIDNPCDLVGYNTTEDLGENRTAKIQGGIF
uniref:Uncharacterized protein n=1 Tax=Branchiostoma floridae TaxID=7739 RepID=C3YKR8_BRAFL|eukprot:XP_002603125.1 hypothetical protein BRAFLDRAFT_63241 [Branchiostoma floridae]